MGTARVGIVGAKYCFGFLHDIENYRQQRRHNDSGTNNHHCYVFYCKGP